MGKKPLYPHIPGRKPFEGNEPAVSKEETTISPELIPILKQLGFTSVNNFRNYMKSHARLNEYGAVCYTEKRYGYTLNYADNCDPKPGAYGIGGNVKGTFRDYRFN